MRKPITGKDVLAQIKADLIGKDSYRGVTLTYTWLANQFGHISLGFIPTLILFQLLKRHGSIAESAFWSPIIISATWLLFETYNFLGPLLSKSRSHSKVLFIKGSEYIFQPAWGNVAFDTITDLLFFWFGALMASVLLFHSRVYMLVITAIALLLIYPSSYWYLTKMYLQIPEYPFQFRLSQWDVEPINKADITNIRHFLINKRGGRHLLIFGTQSSGKTSLGVGIATELSIKHRTCVYLTATKLYSLFFDPDIKPEQLWN